MWENVAAAGDNELVRRPLTQDIWEEQMFAAISIPSEADWEATERQRLFSPLAFGLAE